MVSSVQIPITAASTANKSTMRPVTANIGTQANIIPCTNMRFYMISEPAMRLICERLTNIGNQYNAQEAFYALINTLINMATADFDFSKQ